MPSAFTQHQTGDASCSFSCIVGTQYKDFTTTKKPPLHPSLFCVNTYTVLWSALGCQFRWLVSLTAVRVCFSPLNSLEREEPSRALNSLHAYSSLVRSGWRQELVCFDKQPAPRSSRLTQLLNCRFQSTSSCWDLVVEEERIAKMFGGWQPRQQHLHTQILAKTDRSLEGIWLKEILFQWQCTTEIPTHLTL